MGLIQTSRVAEDAPVLGRLRVSKSVRDDLGLGGESHLHALLLDPFFLGRGEINQIKRRRMKKEAEQKVPGGRVFYEVFTCGGKGEWNMKACPVEDRTYADFPV